MPGVGEEARVDESEKGPGPGWFDASQNPRKPTPYPREHSNGPPAEDGGGPVYRHHPADDVPMAQANPAEPIGAEPTGAALPPTEEPEAAQADPDIEPAAVTGGRARRSRGRTAGLVAGRTFLALLSTAALAATGIGWATLGQADRQVTKTDVLANVPNTPQLDDGATDILLVGSDSRTDAQGRPLPTSVLKQLRTEASTGVNTDTIILIRIPRDGSRAYGLSIPRDTYVSIPGYRDDKINSAYGVLKAQKEDELRRQGNLDAASIAQQSDQAGRRALIGTVQDLTGLKVDHYAEVNLYGFYLLTEAVGGVQVCLKHATADEDSGANFAKGPQNISGGDALSFVRQRKNLPRGDLDRIVRQQVFMAALVKKVLSAGTLTNATAMSGLLDSAKKSVVLDESWDVSAFAQQMQGLTAGAVQFETIPVTSIDGRSERGQSIVTVDKNQVHRFVAGLVKPATPAGGGAHFGGGGIVGLDGARLAGPQTASSASTSRKPPPTHRPVETRTTASTSTPDSGGTNDSGAGGAGDQQGPISSEGIPCVN